MFLNFNVFLRNENNVVLNELNQQFLELSVEKQIERNWNLLFHQKLEDNFESEFLFVIWKHFWMLFSETQKWLIVLLFCLLNFSSFNVNLETIEMFDNNKLYINKSLMDNISKSMLSMIWITKIFINRKIERSGKFSKLFASLDRRQALFKGYCLYSPNLNWPNPYSPKNFRIPFCRINEQLILL